MSQWYFWWIEFNLNIGKLLCFLMASAFLFRLRIWRWLCCIIYHTLCILVYIKYTYNFYRPYCFDFHIQILIHLQLITCMMWNRGPLLSSPVWISIYCRVIFYKLVLSPTMCDAMFFFKYPHIYGSLSFYSVHLVLFLYQYHAILIIVLYNTFVVGFCLKWEIRIQFPFPMWLINCVRIICWVFKTCSNLKCQLCNISV